MPNYVYTSHHITGQEREIRKLYEILQRVDRHPEAKERERLYYGHMWLGYLLQELTGKDPEIECRGQVTGYSMDGDTVLWLSTESAWNAPYELHDIFRQYFPTIRILYFVDVTDEGEMYTNDVKGEVFKTRYGIALEDEDEEFFDTLEEAQAWFFDRLGIRTNTLDELTDAIDNLDEEQYGYINFHECTVIE